jgi:hypothetical protein
MERNCEVAIAIFHEKVSRLKDSKPHMVAGIVKSIVAKVRFVVV